MTTVDKAIEAGARALHDLWDDETEYGTYGEMATTAARAMWPILSAPIRELHESEWSCGNPRHTNPDIGCPECAEYCDLCGHMWPCPTMQEILDIDKELGND